MHIAMCDAKIINSMQIFYIHEQIAIFAIMKILKLIIMKNVFLFLSCLAVFASCGNKANKTVSSSNMDDIDTVFTEVPGKTITINWDLVVLPEQSPELPFMKKIVKENGKETTVFNYYRVKQKGLDSIQCIGVSAEKKAIIVAGLDTTNDFDGIDKAVEEYLNKFGLETWDVAANILHITSLKEGRDEKIHNLETAFSDGNFEKLFKFN